MNVLLREDLRELAIQWAHVLVEDRRLAPDGIDRLIHAMRAEADALHARYEPEHGHGPIRPRLEVDHG